MQLEWEWLIKGLDHVRDNISVPKLWEIFVPTKLIWKKEFFLIRRRRKERGNDLKNARSLQVWRI